MKVILIKDVPQLGGKGEIVDVADGYARNYLVPRALAVEATQGSLRQAERATRARQESLRREIEGAEQIRQTLTGTRVVIAARAGDEGKLFGSIGTADIAEAIKKFTGMEVDRRIIHVAEPIRSIGLHDVDLKPHAEVTFQVTLDVIPA